VQVRKGTPARDRAEFERAPSRRLRKLQRRLACVNMFFHHARVLCAAEHQLNPDQSSKVPRSSALVLTGMISILPVPLLDGVRDGTRLRSAQYVLGDVTAARRVVRVGRRSRQTSRLAVHPGHGVC
jgi:hypothetical protein